MSNRFLIASSLTLVGLLFAGCHHSQPETAQRSRLAASGAATTQPSAFAQPPGAQDTALGAQSPATADSVAQKARTYALQMEKLMNDSAARSASAHQPATQPVEKSAVNWIEPQRDKIVRSEDVTINRPTAQTSAVPNAGLSVNSAAANGSERETAHPPAPTPGKSVEVPAKQVAIAAPVAASSDELIRRLSQHVKDYPQDLGGQLEFQLLQFTRGEAVPDMQTLAGLSPEDREMLSALMDGLSNFRSAVRADNNMLLSRKIKPMLDVADRLRTQAELSVPVVALCTRAMAYGTYDPIQPLRFAAGAEHEVIVYCEIENFSSQLDSQKMWETSLREEIVLYSDQGMLVWTPDKTAPRPSIDRSRTRRHDFFLGRKIKLPTNLSMGRYILKVSVVDQQVNRVAENTVALEIAAQ